MTASHYHLRMTKQARTPEQKRQRADRIVAEALRLQGAGRYDGWTMDEVASRSGVAKGTVFLYFETKEALGLGMTRRLMEEWLDALDRRLEEGGRQMTPAEVAQLVARSLEPRGELRRLLVLLESRFEHNVSIGLVEDFRAWLLERLRATGGRLEAALPFLQSGEGTRLMFLIQALVVGYEAVAEPAPALAELINRPGFEAYRLDFRRAVSEALWMQLEGLRAVRRQLGKA